MNAAATSMCLTPIEQSALKTFFYHMYDMELRIGLMPDRLASDIKRLNISTSHIWDVLVPINRYCDVSGIPANWVSHRTF